MSHQGMVEARRTSRRSPHLRPEWRSRVLFEVVYFVTILQESRQRSANRPAVAAPPGPNAGALARRLLMVVSRHQSL